MRCGTRSSSSRTASCWRSRRSWPRSSPRATSRSRRRSRSALARLVALGAVAPALLLLADGVDQLATLALVVRLPPPLHLALDRGALALAVLFGGFGHPLDRSGRLSRHRRRPCVDRLQPRDELALRARRRETVREPAVGRPVLGIAHDAGQRLARAVVVVGRDGVDAEQRRDVVAHALAVAVVVAAERVLGRLRDGGDEPRGRLLDRSDVAADVVPPPVVRPPPGPGGGGRSRCRAGSG